MNEETNHHPIIGILNQRDAEILREICDYARAYSLDFPPTIQRHIENKIEALIGKEK